MTEELEKEAEDYAEEHKEVDWEGFDKNKEELKQAYLAGAEPREKRIEELEKENKKACHKWFKRWGETKRSELGLLMQIEKIEQEKWTLKTNLEESICIEESYKKKIVELEGQVTRAFEVLEGKREQIQIDAEQIRALQNTNGALTDRVKELEEKLKKETAQRIYNFNKSIEWKEKHRELEAQIEKMKCCGNCIHEINEDDVIVQTDYCDNCFEFCNWKLAD